ncbi:MAG: sensor histidine kinase [Campylobacterales bacterium]
MLPRESIRGEFALKLLPAIAALVFIFSYVVYSLIGRSIYDDIRREMLEAAQQAALSYKETRKAPQSAPADALNSCQVQMVTYEPDIPSGGEIGAIRYGEEVSGNQRLLYLYYPYDYSQSAYLKVTRNITGSVLLLERIRNIILVLNLIAIVFIPVFAFAFSAFLARPIRNLTLELASMNENSLSAVNQRRLPQEFRPLAKTLNSLLRRLQGHIGYQRELFIGIAHELKTPLAVIKAKNDVTLLKERTPEKYQEVLRHTNKVIDEMNRMTGTILEIGRAEYAQFEPAEAINICDFIRKKVADFELLAKEQKRVLKSDIQPKALMFLTQPTLISHILQNLVGNALKFTPEGKQILVRSRLEKQQLIIEVIDEGRGIDQEVDLFAPFVGKGEHKGVGLGLYLAKNAAEALGGSLSLQNRIDAKGAIATLVLEYVKPPEARGV